MSIEQFNWICPSCDADNFDEIDSEDGPFLTCTCGYCGSAFAQADVSRLAP